LTGETPSDLEAVFDRHFEDVYGYVAYRLYPDTEAAEDVTQEVFLCAMTGWPGFRGNSSPLTWLRSIARRKVVDYFRTRDPPRTGVDAGAPEQAPVVDEPGVKERAALIAGAMRALPEDYAELLEEKYLEGLSVREIARRRCRTENAVSMSLFRARRAFRDVFVKLQVRQETSQ